MTDFIEITLGTGMGSGIVCNGKLMYDHDGFAGELGHTIVDPDGRQCKCGRKGCLETYVSATSIKRTVLQILADSVAHTSPQAIFLLGGLVKAGDFILSLTRKYFEYFLLEVYKNKVPILSSFLKKESAGILGASALVGNKANMSHIACSSSSMY